MSRILKVPLAVIGTQTVRFPGKVVRPLTAQIQRDTLMLWVECADVDGAPDQHDIVHVFVVGTGNPIPPEATNYIGTVQETRRPAVWHVYTETVREG